MDKNSIKKYAVWARRELISRVSQKALQYGISEKEAVDAAADSVNGKLLTENEKKQRKALIAHIKEKGFEQVMEEVAYTWFNRFSALRFMEVNGYLPTHVRVFTDEDNNFKPQIITEAIHLEMDGLNMDKVYEYKETNQTEELYKYLLITQCNALNKILPGMFQRIADYTELLFPDNLLREGSVIEQLIAMIPEEDWKDAVQIIGWLYQYYNIEQNELVYDGTLSKSRIPKELVSAATTIYTPDWAVRYMVENSLGRLWLEGHSNDDELKARWKYYLDEAEQEADVQAQLDKIRQEYKDIKPEEIRCIDPCMGSGHILVYVFDVLMQIYETYGYNQREAANSIIKNNLYGLDIDERAAQLAYFAVMMKARQYDRRFFSRAVQPHVYAIRESNHLDKACAEYFENGVAKLKADIQTLMDELYDAKEYGSILNVTNVDFEALYNRFDEIADEISFERYTVLEEFLPFVQVAQTMAQKYDVIVTNPPYLGSSRFSAKLDKYVKEHYADVKSDLSMVMYRRAISSFSKRNGFIAFITTSSWMFLSSFEKLRSYLFENCALESLVDFGTELFEGKVGHNPIVAWVNRNSHFAKKITGVRLVEYCYSRRDEKEPEFFNNKNYYYSQQENFSKIPGEPIGYWIPQKMIDSFENDESFGDEFECYVGMRTGDNNRFLRLWFEVEKNKVAFQHGSKELSYTHKWMPYLKGGEFRRWYYNYDYVVNWEDDGREIKENTRKVYPQLGDNLGWKITSEKEYFREGITFNAISSSYIGFKRYYDGAIFSNASHAIMSENSDELDIALAFLNTKVVTEILALLSPTINYTPSDIKKIPYKSVPNPEVILAIARKNIQICKVDWDVFETSWDFAYNPLVDCCSTIAEAYSSWKIECDDRFNQLKTNEEALNRIFIDIYGLQNEMIPDVEDKDVTVRKADLQRDIKSLISYAVGCMFGRYSLDVPGLAYAGGDWDATKYKTYLANKDNIIPICDDEYFPDDIVASFAKFIETVYGSDTLEENLLFIADALGGKGTPREVIRNYFLNDFYADHCRIYPKRPIYWLYDSGKKRGFKALIYMHRYQPDTLARMRTDYVHEQQARYRTAIENLQQRINGASTAERVKLNKQLIKLQEQAEELRIYEEKIHHLADQMIRIDLDDGVKHNYEIFKDVLVKIK